MLGTSKTGVAAKNTRCTLFTLDWPTSIWTRVTTMPDLNLEELFREYWEGSYPNAPANKQSAASHIAFAQFVLSKMKEVGSEG
jgi:hypothetical protein